MTRSVGILAEGEECIGHVLQVPNTVSRLVEGRVPLTLERLGNGPAILRTLEAHADEMTLLGGGGTVNEARAAMKDGEVVDEVHVTRAGDDLHLSGTSHSLDGVESLDLSRREGGQVGFARVGLRSHERSTTKVHDELAVLVEDDGSALVLGAARGFVSRMNKCCFVARWQWVNLQGKGPVGTRQSANDIGTSGSQDVVDCSGRGDDALATSGSSGSG